MSSASTTKLHHKLVAVTAERDALAAELQKLREQKPVAWLIPQSTLVTFDEDWANENTDYCDPLFLAPVAAPAHKKCAGCNGHGMLGNGHPDCSDVVCHFCGGTGVDSSPAAQAPAPAVHSHPDDAAVDRFAAAMKAKMAASRAKGRGGWEDKDYCKNESLQQMLIGHLSKGDPVDVGNFCMMLWNRGEPVAAPAVPAPSVPEEWRDMVAEILNWWDDQHMTLAQGRAIREKARALLQSAEVRND